jgi:hypothetical protein
VSTSCVEGLGGLKFSGACGLMADGRSEGERKASCRELRCDEGLE